VAIALTGATIDPVCCQGPLHFLPEIVIDDWGVLARISVVLMHDLAAIEAVLKMADSMKGPLLALSGLHAIASRGPVPVEKRTCLSAYGRSGHDA